MGPRVREGDEFLTAAAWIIDIKLTAAWMIGIRLIGIRLIAAWIIGTGFGALDSEHGVSAPAQSRRSTRF